MSRDALIFYSEFDDPEAWRKTLTAELPDLDFHTDPDAVDAAAVHYALAWKPPAGFFARFPNLKLVTNLGAGVDSLVGRDDLPDVPVSRLSDTGMVSLMTSYVLFSVIRYARDIHLFERAQRRGEWKYLHPRALSEITVGVLGLDHVDTHLAEYRQDVLDLLGLDLLQGQQRVDLIVGDVAALLGTVDQLLDGGVRKVEQRAIGRGVGTIRLRHLFLLWRRVGLACHKSLHNPHQVAILPRKRISILV